jgi:hypothetical protein
MSGRSHETPPSGARSPPETSGIDWSIFRDGEDDTFSWLWRANGSSTSGSVPGALPVDATMDSGQFSAALAGVNETPSLTAALLDTHMSETARATAAAVASGASAFAAGSALGLNLSMGSTDVHVAPALSSKASVASSMQDDDDDDEYGDHLLSGDGASDAPPKQSTKGKKRRIAGDDDEKKQQRRVKNLASVREFRKRKMQQTEENEIRLRRLEAENMDLKMRLKIGKDALLSEQREKQEIKDQMREMLARGASEQEVAQFVNMYKVTYSDYGPKRREKLQFHLARIRELLLPTQVTKLCLYSVEQGSEMIARDKDVSDDSISATDAGMAPMSLWGILAKELAVSPAQQKLLLERRASIQKIRDELNHTLGIVKKLEQVTDFKNTALESHIAELQQILTPSQATKFIIWVKENPAFMYMLDKLVDSTLRGDDDDAEA